MPRFGFDVAFDTLSVAHGANEACNVSVYSDGVSSVNIPFAEELLNGQLNVFQVPLYVLGEPLVVLG